MSIDRETEMTMRSGMKSGFLKRCLVALLMLAVASVWQVAPSFAAQPCGMDSVATIATDHSSVAGHCKATAVDCTKAAICCQVPPNLLGVSASTGAPIRWKRVVYSAGARTFAGLRLEPPLHPPSDRA